MGEEGGAPEVVLLATGSEVGLAVEAARILGQEAIRCRVVSLPCLERFLEQPEAYRRDVLPDEGLRVSIEAGRTDGWRSWVGPSGLTIGVDRFGASAPYQVIAEQLGFTGPQVAARIREHLRR
jgi:transketolase